MDILLCKLGALSEIQCQKVFEKMGYTVSVLAYDTEDYDGDLKFLEIVAETMKEKQYDFVFSIFFLPIVSKACKIYRTIYITWIYDSPEIHLYAKAVHNSINRIFLFDRMQYERFHKVSPETIFYMPLAAEPMTEKQMAEITLQDRQLYDHDISFVGSLYNEDDRWYHVLSRLPEYWQGYIQGIMEAQINVYGYNFIADSLTDKAVSSIKEAIGYVLVDDYRVEDREIIADMYIGLMCSAMERHRILELLSRDYDITVYSKSDTSQLPRIMNKGMADPITTVPKIYHCSKINLNITLKTIQSGIPLRVFDVLGCKGFLITNYQPEIVDYFEPGVDLVIYDSMEDLQRKVAYYLEHDEERKQIAENGYCKVCESFTYDIALRQILDIAGCPVPISD